MKSLRSLLRLEDKVAAEGRRLQLIGGPHMRGVAPAALAVAAFLHGILLLVPAVRVRTEHPSPSVATEFPLVWRPPVAVPPPPAPLVPPRSDRTASPAPRSAPRGPELTGEARALVVEPVPEPAPELSVATTAADFEAIIPSPDAPPPLPEAGPPPGSVADVALSPIERVTPVYPRAARTMLAEGHVKLRLTVLPDGSVLRATVEGCSRPGLGFEASALSAVKRWRYEPVPPESGVRTATVTVHFQQQEGQR